MIARSPLGGTSAVLLALWMALGSALWSERANAQFTHYPGAWFDASATAQERTSAEQRGMASVVVYGSQDRIERVHDFYRRFLQELPATGGAAMQATRFCLHRVERPAECRGFVELAASGGGSRIRVFELR